MVCQHPATDQVAVVIIVAVWIVPVIKGSKAEAHECMPMKSVVKSAAMKSAAMKRAAVKCSAMKCSAAEASAKTSSAMAEAPTAVTASSSTSAPAAAVTTAASAATTTTTASQRRGRLRQADGQQRQQRDNRFPHHGSFLLDDIAPEGINLSASRLFAKATVNCP
jgi:cytoskeletal protein RodZ